MTKYECTNPVLEKGSQPLPPQHSLRNCWVLVGIQVALEKIRKKNREDFLNGTKEEDFQFLAQKCKGKPKISHWTLRSPTRLDPGEFEDKMPYELPSEWVNAWVNSSETYPKAEFDFLWEPLRVTPRHQIPGPAHPYLGRALAIFHLGIFRHPGLSWSIFGPPRLSLHAFFFLLCRWKAVLGDGFGEGWMGFPWFDGLEIKWRQHAIASSCSQDTAWTVNCWQPL